MQGSWCTVLSVLCALATDVSARPVLPDHIATSPKQLYNTIQQWKSDISKQTQLPKRYIPQEQDTKDAAQFVTDKLNAEKKNIQEKAQKTADVIYNTTKDIKEHIMKPDGPIAKLKVAAGKGVQYVKDCKHIVRDGLALLGLAAIGKLVYDATRPPKTKLQQIDDAVKAGKQIFR